jgi:hypothetical protein
MGAHIAGQAYWKIRYERLKDRGRCVVCGQVWRGRGVRCEDCKIKATGATKRWQKKSRRALLDMLAQLQAEVAELTARLECKDNQ